MRYLYAFCVLCSFFVTAVHAGPYAPRAGQPGSTAISKDSASFAGWATGYSDYLPGPNVDAAFKTPNKALGQATSDPNDVVSLGDNGSIILKFGGSLFNGPGADFAVFENSFGDTFLELARVWVSSDGNNFFRFPAFSFTANPVSAFGDIDPTNLDGLAGKYRGGYGTPFDLDLLKTVPGLDVSNVRYVKLVDIRGDGSESDDYPGSVGGPHPIYDPFPTVLSGGFDLDAVGAIHLAAIPEPSTLGLLAVGLLVAGWRSRNRRRLQNRLDKEKAPMKRRARVLALMALISLPFAQVAQAAVSTFEDLPLPPQSFFFPATTTTFTSGGATYNHRYSDFGIPGCCWDGWSYSNTTDTTTAGPNNQYSAFAGGGAGGSANYGVGFLGEPTITFATPSIVTSAYFTNTTYAALAIRDGDAFSKKFGGASGNDADFFKLTVIGKNASGATTGSVDVYLADYRFSDNSQDFILDSWSLVDLTGLGSVSSLAFALDSSDKGAFGINTPGYFAIDALSVTAVPEPGAWPMLIVGGVLALVAVRRKRKL